MRRIFIGLIVVMVALSLLSFVGCGSKGCGKGAGGGTELFKYVPETATGVFYVNFKKVAAQPVFDEYVKKAEEARSTDPDKVFENYQDFIDKTGIDPKKDVNAMVMASVGSLTDDNSEFIILVSAQYDKDKVAGVFKEKGAGKFTEETYQDVLILKAVEKEKEMGFAFISNDLFASGNINSIKKVIDLTKGTGNNILSNEKIKGHLEKFKTDADLCLLIDLPQSAKKLNETPMGKFDLTKAEVVLGYIEYSNNTLTGDISLLNPNEAANQQMATTLNAMKGMAAMMGPEMVEVVGKINFIGSADKVSMTISLEKDLMDKVAKAIEEKSKAKAMVPDPSATEGEEGAAPSEGETAAPEETPTEEGTAQ